jgi:hypothetical protein
MATKFAVWAPADQTMLFFTGNGLAGTTKHPEAKLWEDRAEAEALVRQYNGGIPSIVESGGKKIELQRERYFAAIEEVEDEAEFRSREDTW